MKFHHTGLAVKSITKELTTYEKLGGIKESEIFSDQNLGVKVCFVNLGGHRIELVEGIGETSPVNDMIKKGIRMYHQCFEVDSLDKYKSIFADMRAALVVPPTPAVAFNGRRVCFYLLPNRDLIELVET